MSSERSISHRLEKFWTRKALIFKNIKLVTLYFLYRIAETMNVPPDHTFGVTVQPDDLCRLSVNVV